MRKQAPDRRQSSDRRSFKRFAVTIDVEWERAGERHPGTVSDLSEGGCFVLAGGEAAEGDEVSVFMPIGGGIEVRFVGVVTNVSEEIGFAVWFTEVSEAERNVLRNYLMGDEAS